MKLIFCFLSFVILFSCKDEKSINRIPNSTKRETQKTYHNIPFFNENGKHPNTIQFLSHKNKVIVMTTSLGCYSSDFAQIDKRINLYGKVVEIDSITEGAYSNKRSRKEEDLYHLVKIKYDNKSEWVYGKHLYELAEACDTSVYLNGTTFQFIPTLDFKNKSIFNVKSEEVRNGNDTNPLVLFNSKINAYSLIETDNEEFFPQNHLTLPKNIDISKADKFQNNNGVIHFLLSKGNLNSGDCGCVLNFDVDIDLKKEYCRAMVSGKREICF